MNTAVVTVVMPTFNEAGHIAALVRAVVAEMEQAGTAFEVIVVDDDSPDGTAAAVEPLTVDPRVRLEVRLRHRGLAASIRRGIELARGDVVVVMDSDFNHDPKDVPILCDLLSHFDIAIGSRFVMRGGMSSHGRYLLSHLFNVFIRLTVRTEVHDNLSGFFAARRTVLERIDGDSVFFGYGDYFMRMLALARRAGFTVIESPVFYGRRPTGESKTTLTGTLPLYVAAVLRLRLGLDRPRLLDATRA